MVAVIAVAGVAATTGAPSTVSSRSSVTLGQTCQGCIIRTDVMYPELGEGPRYECSLLAANAPANGVATTGSHQLDEPRTSSEENEIGILRTVRQNGTGAPSLDTTSVEGSRLDPRSPSLAEGDRLRAYDDPPNEAVVPQNRHTEKRRKATGGQEPQHGEDKMIAQSHDADRAGDQRCRERGHRQHGPSSAVRRSDRHLARSISPAHGHTTDSFVRRQDQNKRLALARRYVWQVTPKISTGEKPQAIPP
jgi:hypothetical protein